MPSATIQSSGYLDFNGYRVTNQTSVEAAYAMKPADIGNPTYGLNVALILPRANEPIFLSGDWATRQQTIAQYNGTQSLWSTFGADKQQFDTVKQGVKDLGLKVIESSDTASGSYVTSVESRTIWVKIDTAADFNKLFASQLKLWTDNSSASSPILFWNGQLSLPTEWRVSGLWFDLSQAYANPSNLVPGTLEATLVQGPQGVGNAAMVAPANTPQSIAQGYDFPLNGEAVKTGTIALAEPGIGSALPDKEHRSFQELFREYLKSVNLKGTGTVYTQGADGQAYTQANDPDERSLDVGVIAGVNPNSDIGLYVGSGDKGWAQSTIFTSIQSAIWDTSNNPAVISSSFSDFAPMSPSSPFYSAYWQLWIDAALRNQTTLHDSFDGGSGNEMGNGLTNVFESGSSPYSIVVGGTSISSLANGITDPTINTQIIQPALNGDLATIWKLVAGGLTTLPKDTAPLANFVESIWNQYYVDGRAVEAYGSGAFFDNGYKQNFAGTGGVDPTQGVPSYQSAYGLNPATTDPETAIGRGVPDVSGLAGGNLNYLLPNEDMVGSSPNGGTSASTPLWATLISQFNFIFADQGLPNLGYMNDLLYIASAIAPASFNDITYGNNTSSFVQGQGTYRSDSAVMPTGFGYTAETGYDLVSGLGSPDGVLLGRTLTAIAHEQMYFDSVPDVLNLSAIGVWTAGANETLSFQATSVSNLNLSFAVGSTGLFFTGGPSASYAWTSRFAEQSLQPDFDPALVRLYDKQSQALVTQTTLAAGESVQVGINSVTAQPTQGSLTTDFGFVDFVNGHGTVRVAQPIMVAETAGGLNGETAIVRIRQTGTDSLAVTFYKVDDYTGAIGNLHPGDAGYAAAAASRAYQLSSGGTSIGGPGDGNYGQAAILNVNAGDLIAQTLINRTTGNTFWAFAAANETAGGQHLVHQWNYGLNVVGWEATLGGGDRDYNDLVVGVDFTSAFNHAYLM